MLAEVSGSGCKHTYMLLIIAGIILLYIGAEGLVRGSASLATRVGVSPLIAGLTVVAFGTSAPELSVSVSAALEGRSDIALGNVVGSNIFNIAVILGIAALIQPLRIQLAVIRRDIPVMIGASALAFALVLYGGVPRSAGLVLLLGLGLYLFFTIRSAKGAGAGAGDELIDVPPLMSKSWVIDGLVLVGGLGVLILGSRLFVDGATVLAKGPTTVVADPSGECLMVRAADQRLATAGTGDVLTGLVAAHLALGMPATRAAAAASHLHGLAARLGPARGLVASDLPDLVPCAWQVLLGA